MSAALAAVLATGLSAGAVTAQVDPGQAREPRWAIGLQLAPADLPRGHLGIPVGGSEDGLHLGAAVVLRRQMSRWWALNLGLGLPTSAMGPALWIGHEVFHRLWADPREVVAFEAYEDAALQLGFAGPDYYARHGDTFVGYSYAFGGPAAFALRLPVGLRIDWLRSRFDTYVEGVSIVSLTPSVEALFELAVGARVHF